MFIKLQSRLFTVVILTSLLSLNGLIFSKIATALTIDILPEHHQAVAKQNIKADTLPQSVVDAIRNDISRREGIAPKNLKIADYNSRTWRNGCLELAQPDEICTQALVPGWRVVVTHGQKKWVYHTNQTGSVIRLKENSSNTINPVRIPPNQLPPALDRNTIFREISSGGFAGRTYETILLNDGRLIRVRIGDANDSERSVRRVDIGRLRQFQRIINSAQSVFRNVSYPAPGGAADFITYTLTSRRGTVQYNDISRNNLPGDVDKVIKAWNQLISTAK